MRLLCWNINSLPPTVSNAQLKYGSWKGFFDEHALDILCLQVSALASFSAITCRLPPPRNEVACFHTCIVSFSLIQEAKVPYDKLTKEICCVEGFQVRNEGSKIEMKKKGRGAGGTHSIFSFLIIICSLFGHVAVAKKDIQA